MRTCDPTALFHLERADLGNRHSSGRGNKAFSLEVIIQRDDDDEVRDTNDDRIICTAGSLPRWRTRRGTSFNEAKVDGYREAKQS